MGSNYYLIFEQGEKFVIGFCPDVPGANGQGRTQEECTRNIMEAIDLIKKTRAEDKQSNIPLPFLRHLCKHGCLLKRESANHLIYSNAVNSRLETVPKQVEIDDILKESVCRKLGIPPPWEKEY